MVAFILQFFGKFSLLISILFICSIKINGYLGINILIYIENKRSYREWNPYKSNDKSYENGMDFENHKKLIFK